MEDSGIAPNIVDNTPDRELVHVIKDQLKKSQEAKFAIGYFSREASRWSKMTFPIIFPSRSTRSSKKAPSWLILLLNISSP